MTPANKDIHCPHCNRWIMHPTRHRIIARLKQDTELNIQQLSRKLDIRYSTVHWHLAILEKRGLVSVDHQHGRQGSKVRLMEATQ